MSDSPTSIAVAAWYEAQERARETNDALCRVLGINRVPWDLKDLRGIAWGIVRERHIVTTPSLDTVTIDAFVSCHAASDGVTVAEYNGRVLLVTTRLRDDAMAAVAASELIQGTRRGEAR